MLPNRFQSGLAMLLLGIFLAPAYAHAYLDPGSGNYLLQMLIGGLVGAGYAVKMFWQRISDFLSRVFRRSSAKSE